MGIIKALNDGIARRRAKHALDPAYVSHEALEEMLLRVTELEEHICELVGVVEPLREDWQECKDELDKTFAKVHSELGLINRRRRQLREDPTGATSELDPDKKEQRHFQ